MSDSGISVDAASNSSNSNAPLLSISALAKMGSINFTPQGKWIKKVDNSKCRLDVHAHVKLAGNHRSKMLLGHMKIDKMYISVVCGVFVVVDHLTSKIEISYLNE